MSLRKKTFTLIEMLIVVVIIGILAAALIPRLQGVQGRARDVQRKTGLSQIGQGIGVARQDGLSFSTLIVSGNPVDANVLVPSYLASLPTDPSGTTRTKLAEFSSGAADGKYGGTGNDTTNILILGAFTEIKGSSNGNSTGIVASHTASMTGAITLTPSGGATGKDGDTNLRYYYIQ